MAFYFDNGGTGSGAGFAPQFIGSRASPYLIDAVTGIDLNAMVNDSFQVYIYIAGNGGAVNISANPQITAGANEGQRIVLIGCSDADTVQINMGNGLLINGTYILTNGVQLELFYDSTGTWVQVDRQ